VDELFHAHEHLESVTPKIASGVVFACTDQPKPWAVMLDKGMTNRILGTAISDAAVEGHLNSLGLGVEQGDDEGSWRVVVPTYRADLERPIDLVEEIARLHGFDQIPTTLPTGTMGYRHQERVSDQGPTIIDGATRALSRSMRRMLLDQGLHETVNYSFVGAEELEQLGLDDMDERRKALPLTNPLIKTQGLMRTTLVTSLLQNLATNLAQRQEDVALFEYGRCYFSDRERRMIGILLKGVKANHWSGRSTWDFYDLKGIVEGLASSFDLSGARWDVPEVVEPYLHPGVQAKWFFDGLPLATVGQLHPAQAQQREIGGAVFIAEIDLDLLLSQTHRQRRFKALPRFPGVSRDFALLYDRSAPYGQLREAIDEIAARESELGDILESVELFDLYEGAQIPEGKRSLALSLVYRSSERTLTEDDIERADRLVLDWLGSSVGARLR
jgi:phenylalanyl-tRNA synthetase beta chain